MENQTGDLNAVIEERIDSDSEFQSSLEGLDDNAKDIAIKDKKLELFQEESAKVATIAKDQKGRAEKAERDFEEYKKNNPKEEKKEDISSKDLYALFEAKVPREDVDEMVKASKLLDLSISDTLKDSFVKSRLDTLAEQRKTAGATNTGKGKVATKTSDSVLLDNFNNDKLPEPGSEDAERLFWLRRGIDKKKN